MSHRIRILAALVVLAAAMLAPAAAYGLPLNGSLPTLPASPATIPVPAAGSSQVYRVSLVAGETLSLSLSRADASLSTLDLDLFLYGPASTETSHTAALRKSTLLATGYPELISYQAAAGGTYYVEVFWSEETGAGVLTWSVLPEPLLPVYRFYNVRTGTHFYTPSDAEANTVKTQWANVFRYEGVAYSIKASRNDTPLYRLYNRRTGSHFYTASADEVNRVLATWPGVFQLDGATYAVSTSNGGGTKAPVYRFYNVRNGSHFYTASASEKATVETTWAGTYRYEGIAFYLGQ